MNDDKRYFGAAAYHDIWSIIIVSLENCVYGYQFIW